MEVKKSIDLSFTLDGSWGSASYSILPGKRIFIANAQWDGWFPEKDANIPAI
jgi:hypothetical protein